MKKQIRKMIATVVFGMAVVGSAVAAEKTFDWFGGYVCGIAVAIGGGTIRDYAAVVFRGAQVPHYPV